MKIKGTDINIALLSMHMLLLILNGSQFFEIGNRSIFYLLIILNSCVILVWGKARGRNHDIKLFSIEKVISAVMIIFTFVSVIYINTDYQRGVYLASLLFFSLIFFWSNMKYDFNQLERLKKFYILSALILAIGIIIFRYQPYTDISVSRMTIQSYTGEFYDVNFISAYMVIPTIFLLYDFFEKTKKSKSALVKLIILIGAIVLTGSRGALGVLGIAMIFTLWHQKKIGATVLFGILALIVAVPIIIQLIPQDILIHYLKGVNVFNDTRRMADWELGVALIARKPLFGYGMVSSYSLIVTIFNITWLTVHNTYLVFGVNYGVIFGSMIVLLMIIPLYRLIKFKAPYVYSLAYMMFLVSVFLIEANFSDIMIIPVCIFFSYAAYYKENRG